MAGLRKRFAMASAERYLLMAMRFAQIIALSRILSPTEVGVIIIARSLIGMIDTFRTMGTQSYVVQAKQVTADTIRSVYGVSLSVGALFAIVIAALALPAAGFYGQPDLANILWLMALSFIVVPLNTPVMSLLERDMRYGAMFTINMSGATASIGTSIALALMGWGPVSIAVGQIAGSLASLLVSGIYRPPMAWVLPSLKGARKVLFFGGKVTYSSLVTALGANGSELIVGRFLGMESVAHLGRARSAPHYFNMAITGVVNRVSLAQMAKLRRENKPIGPFYVRSSAYIVVLAWPFYAFLGILSEPAILLLFGDQWTNTAPLMRLIVVGAIIGVGGASLAQAVLMAHGQAGKLAKQQTLMQGVRLALVVAGSFYSVTMVAVLMIVSSVFSAAVQMRSIHPYVKESFRGRMKVLAQCAAATAGAMAGPIAVAMGPFDAAPPWVPIGLGLLSAIPGWFAGVLLVRHPIADEFHVVFKNLRRLLPS